MKTAGTDNYEKWCEEWRLRFLDMDQRELLKRLPMNPLGSFFYGTSKHGHPIVGDFILAILEQGYWTAPEEKQVEEWKAKMERDFQLKE